MAGLLVGNMKLISKTGMARALPLLCASLLIAGCSTTPAPKRPPIKLPPVIVQPKPMPPSPSGPPSALVQDIEAVWKAFPGKTGIAIHRINGGGEWTIGKRLGEYFPQQSVSKLLVAMTILEQVDQGKVSLEQMVKITPADLTLFNQPIRDRVLVDGEATEPVQVLMEIAITDSDCTANDALLRLAGGPSAVRGFIARHDLGKIRFGDGERAMQSSIAGLAWRQEYSVGNNFFKARDAVPNDRRKVAMDRYLADPYDGAAPDAITNMLTRLAKGELLSAKSTKILTGIMSRVNSGPNRLKAGLPSGWQLMHKTGTGQILSPISTGYNDVGIVTTPDGTRYSVAVMIASTTATVPERMSMMQSVTRALALYHRK